MAENIKVEKLWFSPFLFVFILFPFPHSVYSCTPLVRTLFRQDRDRSFGCASKNATAFLPKEQSALARSQASLLAASLRLIISRKIFLEIRSPSLMCPFFRSSATYVARSRTFRNSCANIGSEAALRPRPSKEDCLNRSRCRTPFCR